MKWYELVRVLQGLCASCASKNPVIVVGLLGAIAPSVFMLKERLKHPLCRRCQEQELAEDNLVRRYRYARTIGMPSKQASAFAADVEVYKDYGVAAVVTSKDSGYGFYDSVDPSEIYGSWETVREATDNARRCGFGIIAYDQSSLAF